MATTIKIKHSTTIGNAPSSLEAGELAINVADGNLFYGDGSGVSQDFTVNTITAEQYIVSSSVTNVTFQQQSGSTIFGDSADDTHTFTGNITALNDISSSGDIYGSQYFIDGLSTINAPSTNTVRFGFSSFIDSIEYGKQTTTTHLFRGSITGSSDISASGTITANSFTGDGSSLTGVGTVDTTGTPADNQIAIFTDANTIEGTTKLTFSDSDLLVHSVNSDNSGVEIFGGTVGTLQPYISPVGGLSTLRFGDGTSGHTFDFQNNKIAFDQDSTNTYIMADTDTPENLEIHVDGNLEIHAPISTAITASAGISASRIDASIGNLIFDEISSVTTTTPKGEIIKYGEEGSAVSAGSIYMLHTNGKWNLASATVEVSSSGLLGVAVSNNASDGFLIRGVCDLVMGNTTPTGSALYLTQQVGRATHAPTSASGNVIRAVGYALSGGSGVAYFNPDATYIVAS